ncbi:hypothetical protein COD67_14635 [Bacillus cereus]|nr:hypothetical protein COI89_05960 [Bacillus cereus]PGU65991.1 hypothetical protein COD67_14635 [Bacillus cereus]
MKKIVWFGTVLVTIIGIPFSSLAATEDMNNIVITPTSEKKSDEDFNKLSVEDQKIVKQLEDYITKRVKEETNGEKRSVRSVEDIFNNIVTDIAFEVGFVKDTIFIDIANKLFGFGNYATETDWYKNLDHKTEWNMGVYDKSLKQNINISAKYIDNGSDTTILLQHGWRGNSNDLLFMAQYFDKIGYNIILPDARSHGNSEGKYITFGAYEKDDLNLWLDRELENKPNQELIVLGASMGAAITMLSQETPHDNVIAYIEDCGYKSAEQQFRDILRMINEYLQYIPLVNANDWYGKETQLLELLNDRRVKPELGIDLFKITPIEAVKASTLPKLFIHGEADTFIDIKAYEALYSTSIGYKEGITFPGAGHAMSFYTDPNRYISKVMSFLNNVRTIQNDKDSKRPVIAKDTNLLSNPTFEMSENSFTDWEISDKNNEFTNQMLSLNSYNEFVLATRLGKDTSTATHFKNGVRFYSYSPEKVVALGQKVRLTKGETYELSFNATNVSSGQWTYPGIHYGIGSKIVTEPLATKQQTTKKLSLTAEETSDYYARFGSNVAYYSWIDVPYAHAYFENIQLINLDRTPPEKVQVENVDLSIDSKEISIKGYGEPNSKIIIIDDRDTNIASITTDDKGFFECYINSLQTRLLHIVNQDNKGNQSASKVIHIK